MIRYTAIRPSTESDHFWILTILGGWVRVSAFELKTKDYEFVTRLPVQEDLTLDPEKPEVIE